MKQRAIAGLQEMATTKEGYARYERNIYAQPRLNAMFLDVEVYILSLRYLLGRRDGRGSRRAARVNKNSELQININ